MSVSLRSLVCRSCGCNDLQQRGSFYVCAACGTKHVMSEDGQTISIYLNGKPTLEKQYQLARAAYANDKFQEAATLYKDIQRENPGHWEPIFYLKLIDLRELKRGTAKVLGQELMDTLPVLMELIRASYDVIERQKAVDCIVKDVSIALDRIWKYLDKRDNQLKHTGTGTMVTKEEIASALRLNESNRYDLIFFTNDFRSYLVANFVNNYINKIYLLLVSIVYNYAEFFGDFVELHPESEEFFWSCYDMLQENHKEAIQRRYLNSEKSEKDPKFSSDEFDDIFNDMDDLFSKAFGKDDKSSWNFSYSGSWSTKFKE